MTYVPKKNISSKLYDIKYDKIKNNKKSADANKFSFHFKKIKNKDDKKTTKYILITTTLILLTFGILYAINLTNTFKDSLNYIIFQATILKESIFNSQTGEMKNSLSAINNEIQNLDATANNYGITELLNIIGQFNGSLKKIPGAFKNISSISEKSAEIATNIDYLKNNALQLIFNQKGDELVEKLNSLETDLDSLEKLTTEFKTQALEIKNLSSKLTSLYKIFDDNYLSITLNIYKAKELVAALNSIIKSPEDNKILLIFQNPTEIRPAGGFIGSFGYITINRGSVKEIKIDDIYNADRQLNINVAPPKQLSAITTTWGARDANWFFDFPTSAQKISYFLENSKLFSDNQTRFENIISINTNFLQSLIEIAGPIEMPQYQLTINSENFLKEIQYEVEAGQDKQPGQNPKRILSALAPILIEKIKNLDDAGKIKMIKSLKQAVGQKDIMAFSKNDEIQKIFVEYNISGKTFSIPKNFNGDYLAIINSNIAGGKSDAFINQQILLQSQITDDGSIYNTLSISRTHSGQNEKDWWYRATNKDYLKIWVPLNSEIMSVFGNDDSPYSYINPAKNLIKDNDLQNTENTYVYNPEYKVAEGQEWGKKSISTWLNTPAGKTKNFKITYKENKIIDIKDGMQFNFVFDKQSGVQGSLEYEIIAPPGYIWQESQKPKFFYGTQDILARETLKLTLKKNLIP